MNDGTRGSDEENSRHVPRNPNIDPSAEGDPDLEPGGGVRPGRTPPESNSATSTPPHRAPRRPSVTRAGIVLGAILVVAIGLIFLSYALGLLA
ncbi:DUF6480 family protein [Brevibacterium album]|uniref:DUF6480 family protein n=1 Tax=Brevibacterium album TaxID=417948 RepID=UPI00041F8494|nr:DUF6480 family protein [Brevibacterium album]